MVTEKQCRHDAPQEPSFSQPDAMKLRILDNSLRLRLSRSEVNTLVEKSLLQASVRFAADSHLEYRLESSPASVAPTAQFAEGVLRVTLPESTVVDWAGSDRVGIESEQTVDNSSVLRLLVEKDFQCLTPRDEDGDMFPHPEAGSHNC